METDEYQRFDGVGLAGLIARGEVSRGEVRAAAIRVIEARNPEINAVVRTAFDHPAHACPGGALDGVPFLLKDANLFSEGIPTTFGSRYFRDARPRGDSTLVRRWRAAGLAILGKTNTPEFTAEFVTEPRAFGVTRNPVNPGRTVGGSSGGAAAAVASGMVPIAHATDLAGSIRVPAACCDVFGFKPSARLNTVGPWFDAIAGGLNSDHVLTRSTRDSAASLDITAPGPTPDHWLAGSRIPPRRLRIGFTVLNPSGTAADRDQQAGVAQARDLLAALGHEVTEYLWPGGLEIGAWFDHLWILDIPDLIASHQAETGRAPEADELEPLTWALLEIARHAGEGARNHALHSKARWAARWLASWSGIDVLLTPALGTAPPPDGALAFARFADVDAWSAAGYRFAPFSVQANIAGAPSAACPFLGSAGDPGPSFQLTARPGDDLLLLRLCAEIEAACGGTGHG